MRKAKSTYLYSAFVLGLLSIAIQTIFLRELFAVYGFSEILLAVLLFFWLLWGAIGSITHHRGNFLSSIVAFGVLGVVIPLVVRISALKLRPVFGMTTPFWDVFIAGFLCSAPTFFAGKTFSALAKMDSPAKLYAAEGIGSLVGGIVAAVSLSAVPPEILLSVLALIAISPLILNVPRRFITFVMLLAAAYLSDVFLIPPVNSILWRGFTTQEIESPYGRIFIMQKSGENYIFENGRLVASSGDSLSCEQIVHPVMWAHFSPQKVLIIGGAMKGAVRDAAKHGVSQIVVPFPDEKLLEVAFATMPVMRNLHIGSDVDAEFVPAEVRSVLAEERNFDVIVSMPGFPETGADNRFWTEEFFKKVKFALSDSGIFAAALPVGANYLSEYQNEMAASIWMTAKRVFPDAEIYFLDGVVLIAAEKGGQIQLRERLLSKNLRRVNAATVPVDYLPILFQKERSKTLEHQLNDAYFVRINNDWEPGISMGNFSAGGSGKFKNPS
ncbi:hypothetical protein J7M00_08910 [bacterium]|nr:hypothetical protein [bacterium]